MRSVTPTEKAASLLISRRLKGQKGDLLPADCRPNDNQSAFAIQQAVSRLWFEQLGDTVGAWKCLQPIDGKWVVAPIFTSTINTVPPTALWPDNGVARIEPELVFYFAQDLPARAKAYLPDEIDAAIGRTHMALELIYFNYAQTDLCTHFDKLADGLVNQGLFVGPQVATDLAKAASHIDITLSYAQNIQHFAGKHPNIMPRAPLYWLVEFLRQQGVDIEAGQAVITGSYAGLIDVPLNTDIRVKYAGLGEMDVHFKARG
jgi:2-keto-4-pentenoate hydratase